LFIFPTPSKIEEKQGSFHFKQNVMLTLSDTIKHDNLLCELWNQFTAGVSTLTIQKIKTHENIAYLSTTGNYSLTPKPTQYEYEIQVNSNCISIGYTDEKGFAHAFSTVLQMIHFKEDNDGELAFYIPCCNIYDRPVLKFRGIHLCVFPETTLDFLRKAVRLAGFAKYSHIVIEFWGTLKYDTLKELGWECAYTKEEIKPIIDDAHSLGMEVIPMFNHLGHAAQSRCKYGRHTALDQNPKLQTLFEPDGWTWCLSNPKTLDILRNVRKELIELCGEGKYFHLGCDEAYTFATCPICRKHNKSELLLNYLNGLAKELQEYNRIPIIWGDNLLERKEWESTYTATSDIQGIQEILNKMDKNIIINDWQYRVQEGQCKTSEYFKKKGFQVIVSPWLDVPNIKALTEATIQQNLFGVLLTTWHTIHSNIAFILYAASLMWEGTYSDQDSYQNRKYFDLINLYSAAYLRKLCPANGNYLKAGWKSKELDGF